MTSVLKAPFPYFGGKSKVASEVWKRFGNVKNYVEPFFGSGAVLLSRPHEGQIETVNDLDCYLANFWRAVQRAPDEVAEWANWPVSEADLHARHLWLLQYRPAKVQADPDYFDAKIAGWWLWGLCAWIGGGWCSGNGPWQSVDGELTDTRKLPHLGAGCGIKRQRPHLGNAGQGINRKLPHLGNAGRGINRQLPHLGDAGRGINRQLPHLGDAGQGINRKLPQFETRLEYIKHMIVELSDRLRDVRICCGDWTRITGPSVTVKHGETGIFLDPPYADTANRDKDLYREDSLSVAHDVRKWAIEHGSDPKMRIALCGYEGEHEMPSGWECLDWKAQGGYGAGRGRTGEQNRHRERVWFSPACLRGES